MTWVCASDDFDSLLKYLFLMFGIDIIGLPDRSVELSFCWLWLVLKKILFSLVILSKL